AHGHAVELAVQLGEDEADGARGARAARDDGGGGGARAAEILVGQVEDALVVGVGVDGGHQAAPDAERLVQHLGDGGEAVGGARGVGDDGVPGRVVGAVVHAHADGQVRRL